jgi:hypothetical protein
MAYLPGTPNPYNCPSHDPTPLRPNSATIQQSRSMAIDQKTSIPTARVERRSHDAVYKNVCTVAAIGIGNGGLRTAPLADLLWAARIIRYGREDTSGQQTDEIDDPEMIEYALSYAISGLDGSGPKSMPALFGLTENARSLSHTKRREEAVDDGELAITAESFRTHHEKSLLSEVARVLCHLADERIMNDREARLEQRESDIEARAIGNGDMSNTARAHTAARFQELLGPHPIKESPRASADIVQTRPTPAVREAEPDEPDEPHTIGEALHIFGVAISHIYEVIMRQCDPGQYRRYVARNPRGRNGIRARHQPPRPVRTPLEYAAAASLLLVTLFLTSAIVIGLFVTTGFFAHLIFG